MSPRLGLGNSVTASPASGLFASTPLLLDTYPNAHRAYSVRKLRTEYTGYVMKVRESGNDYTADVSFDDDGFVSASSLVANKSNPSAGGPTLGDFIGGSNDGFVTVWYDQSGEGSNATQSIAVNQPKIYSGGSLITEGSKAALLFSGDLLKVDEAGLTLGSITTFAVMSHTSTSFGVPWNLSYASGNYYLHFKNGTEDQYWYDSGDVASHSTNTSQRLFSYTSGSGTDKQIMYANGVASSEKGDSTDTSSSLTDNANNGIGGIWDLSLFYGGEFQEFIVYDSDQSSNVSNVESNINTAFSIY